MSQSEQEQLKSLAARVASRLSQEAAQRRPAADENAATATAGVNRELAALRVGLSEIKQRLAHLESHVVGEEPCAHDSPEGAGEATRARQPRGTNAPPPRWTSSTYVPVVPAVSEQRFSLGEAVSELPDYFEQGKTCSLEPGDKPCDHCSMCSSRGF